MLVITPASGRYVNSCSISDSNGQTFYQNSFHLASAGFNWLNNSTETVKPSAYNNAWGHSSLSHSSTSGYCNPDSSPTNGCRIKDPSSETRRSNQTAVIAYAKSDSVHGANLVSNRNQPFISSYIPYAQSTDYSNTAAFASNLLTRSLSHDNKYKAKSRNVAGKINFFIILIKITPVYRFVVVLQRRKVENASIAALRLRLCGGETTMVIIYATLAVCTKK